MSLYAWHPYEITLFISQAFMQQGKAGAVPFADMSITHCLRLAYATINPAVV